MAVENIMYFALGTLLALLVALMLAPAVWRRAVRLTKKRIEAATPMTMAEFRADKDQLRAEFAITTRKLEIEVETLRNKLAEQVSSSSRKRIDAKIRDNEREQHAAAIAEFEQRDAELRERVAELEAETANLAQRLQLRERDYTARLDELDAARSAIAASLPDPTGISADELTGDYSGDTTALLTALAVERKRSAYLDAQAKNLADRLESLTKRSEDAALAIAEMRRAVGRDGTSRDDVLIAAEARIASAESQLQALVDQTALERNGEIAPPDGMLAEQLSYAEQLEGLQRKVHGVEDAVLHGLAGDPEQLRRVLSEIAVDVSQLVHAPDEPARDEVEESLFDKVQRFAEEPPATSEPEPEVAALPATPRKPLLTITGRLGRQRKTARPAPEREAQGQN